MKKLFTILVVAMLSVTAFAQTIVAEKKLAATLEKNKKEDVVFISEIDLSKMTVAEDGSVSIPLFAKSKAKIVSRMDMVAINSRLEYSKLNKWNTTFEVEDLATKTYAITNIDGIETVAEYNERLKEEARKERKAKLTTLPLKVRNTEYENLTQIESAWLPEMVYEKVKSNIQDSLGLNVSINKKESARFEVITKVNKSKSGYSLTLEFSDLYTGDQMAKLTSKEYSKPELLYGATGAIDQITLGLAEMLELEISYTEKELLTNGNSNLSIEEQLKLSKKNIEKIQKGINDYNKELEAAGISVQEKIKLEAEKALLVEKQNAEKKRQEELKAQKARADQDAKREAERSIALKTQRDQMAKDAAAKAAEVRKLKLEKQDVLGQISVLESKKKALVEIRQGVESCSKELHEQMIKDRVSEESRIRNKNYSTVELGLDGKPTEEAKIRREKQVIKSNEDLTNKFFVDCDNIKKSVAAQEAALLAEIRADQKALSKIRTVSSMGDELKISYGKYEGSQNAWIAYVYLYSEGILIYEGSFWISYQNVTGKKAPDMKTELNDAVIEEYTNNVDMYSSLLARGDPIIYFEIDYNVTAESDEKPSEYKFNFLKARTVSTFSGNVLGYYTLNDVRVRTMKPQWDLREIEGIVYDEWIRQIDERKKTDYENEIIYSFCKGSVTLDSIPIAETKTFEYMKEKISKLFTMKKVTGRNFKIMTTEVTQKLYTSIMGSNPSYNKGDNNPVECVSWYDAIYFCNKLSERFGFTPVYSVEGTTDVTKWNYTPHNGNSIRGDVTWNKTANGFRLPTNEEWEYAARGGQNYAYSGSNNLDEVGWYKGNSENRTHPVAQKKANGYGLYDMSGNIMEWCWDVTPYICDGRYYLGGSYDRYSIDCRVSDGGGHFADEQYRDRGFRVVCSASN